LNGTHVKLTLVHNQDQELKKGEHFDDQN
jgi:hypothetical protein